MKDVIELAKQAGFQKFLKPADRPEMICDPAALERFAALVRNAALDEAAQACDSQADRHDDDARCENDQDYKSRYLVYAKHERRCAAVIRKLKEPTP